jgi:dTDP-glucose pyrophosphorylase
MSGLTGVILSAGKGSRIDPFNAHYPKPLLPVGNRPIIGHHVEKLKALGCGEVVLVVGHLMDRIIDYYGRGDEVGVPIRYVEQEQTLGIAHAASKVESHVEGPMVLCLGDIFYLTTSLHRLTERYRKGDVAAVLAVMEDRDPSSMRKNFSVEIGADGFVSRVVEKPRTPRSTLKGCGIYVFGPEIFDAVRKTPRTALRDEYEITTSIQILIDDGLKVAAESVVDWDLNVTFPEDLLTANLRWMKHEGVDSVVAPTARVHPGARVTRSVLGDGVVVDAPVTIDECVLLPKSSARVDMRRAIVSRELVIRC